MAWHSLKLCKYEQETSSRRNHVLSQSLNTVQFVEYEFNYSLYNSVPLEPHPKQLNAIKTSLKIIMTRGHNLGLWRWDTGKKISAFGVRRSVIVRSGKPKQTTKGINQDPVFLDRLGPYTCVCCSSLKAIMVRNLGSTQPLREMSTRNISWR